MAELKYEQQTPVLMNHADPVWHVEATIDALLGEDNRVEAKPVLAGEDFSVYLRQVSGCFFWLGSGPAVNAEHAHGLHHPKFNLNEECLAVGAALMAGIALRRLEIRVPTLRNRNRRRV